MARHFDLLLGKIGGPQPGPTAPAKESGPQRANTSAVGAVSGCEVHPHPSRSVGSISVDAKALSPDAPDVCPTGLPASGDRQPHPVGLSASHGSPARLAGRAAAGARHSGPL